MKKITHAQLVEILRARKGTFPVCIVALTDAKAPKTGNPFGKIFKLSQSVGFTGAGYEGAVKREAGRQEVDAQDFKADPLPYGEWVIPNKVLIHNGNFQLRVQNAPGQKHPAKVLKYQDEKGNELDRVVVAPFLPDAGVSKKQVEAGLDEDKTIKVKNFKFSSIKKIRVGGKTFELIHPEPAPAPAKKANKKVSKFTLEAREQVPGERAWQDYKDFGGRNPFAADISDLSEHGDR